MENKPIARNLAYSLKIKGVPKEKIKREVQIIIQMLNLGR